MEHARIPSGGGGGGGYRGSGVSGPPMKNHKNKGFLSITGPDPLKKQPSQCSMLDHRRPTSKTQFKWRFAGGPMMENMARADGLHVAVSLV